jgi:hypothetical protein
VKQNIPNFEIGDKPQKPDTQYEVEILTRSGEVTIFFTIDQIVDICNEENLWVFKTDD